MLSTAAGDSPRLALSVLIVNSGMWGNRTSAVP